MNCFVFYEKEAFLVDVMFNHRFECMNVMLKLT